MGGMDTLIGAGGDDTFAFYGSSASPAEIMDFDPTMDKIGLYVEYFNFFSGGVFNADNFAYLNAASYEGTGVTFGNGETSGLVYASVADSATGMLYYDPDSATTGGEFCLAMVSEMGMIPEEDNNVTAESFVEVTM